MPLVSIRHLTEYRYRNPVGFGEHRVMFRPLDSFDQRVLGAELTVSPDPALVRDVHDLNGAAVTVVRFDKRAETLRFESRVSVEHTPHAPFDLESDSYRLGKGQFAYPAIDADQLASSIALRHPEAAAQVEAWARRFLLPVGKTRVSTLLSKMTHAIREDFQYGKRLSGAPQSPLQTLERGGGSCRDYAVLMIEAARSLGLAARFVSGYVYSGSPKANTVGGGHTHAWVRVYLPDCGWADFDPTNGIVGSASLIRTAVAVDPTHALPLHGSYKGLASDYLGMDVEVEVEAMDRETAPARLRARS
jgi:transglutaminase-like putative cysteine protease